jgi:hypothetical protein
LTDGVHANEKDERNHESDESNGSEEVIGAVDSQLPDPFPFSIRSIRQIRGSSTLSQKENWHRIFLRHSLLLEVWSLEFEIALPE